MTATKTMTMKTMTKKTTTTTKTMITKTTTMNTTTAETSHNFTNLIRLKKRFELVAGQYGGCCAGVPRDLSVTEVRGYQVNQVT